MKETIAKINKTKSWFYEKISNNDQPLARLKKKRERTQINKIRSEKRREVKKTNRQRKPKSNDKNKTNQTKEKKKKKMKIKRTI